jgi:protein TonB
MSEKKHKNFLNYPTYPGGNKAMNEFIAQNLQYPEAALKDNISGSVHLQYVVNDDGIIESVQVIKGLGYGCDEEAVRVVKLLKFGRVTNRGKRLKSTRKIKINFNKITIGQSIIYDVKSNNDDSTKISYKIQF